MKARITLVPTGAVKRTPLPELGAPAGIFSNAAGDVVAVSGDFCWPQWSGRDADCVRQAAHRLCVFRTGFRERLAIIESRYPINEVAFHPTAPVLVAATGSYDGGYDFEGELLCIDYSTGESLSLFSKSREFTRVRFDKAGRELLAVVRPPNEEDSSIPAGSDPHSTFFSIRLSEVAPWRMDAGGIRRADEALSLATPFVADASGFATPVVEGDCAADVSSALADASRAGTAARARRLTWGLCWVEEDQLVFGGEGQLFGACDASGVVVQDQPFDGTTVEILPPFSTGQLWVNAIASDGHSTLVQLDSHTFRTLRRIEFSYPVTASRCISGHMLARRVDGCAGDAALGSSDVLLSPLGDVLARLELGRFDLFNHALNLSGGTRLYYIEGSGPHAIEDKRLIGIDPMRPDVRIEWKLDPCVAHQRHLCHIGGTVSVSMPSGDNLVVFAEVPDLYPIAYGTRTFFNHGYAYRIDTSSSSVYWGVSLETRANAVAFLRQQNVVCLALANGPLLLVDGTSGELVGRYDLSEGELPTVGLALAATESRLAVGTVDGRVLIFTIQA